MFTVFVVVPIVGGLALSFTTWDITNGFPKWVGLANYHKMFADPLVWQAVETTLKFIVFGVVPTIAISLGLAMLINFKFRFVSVVRSLYLIPAAMSFAASAVVWRYIFLDGPGYGVLDYVISRFGITPPDWLASQTWALPALDIITVWLSLPTATILYLAALQRIPDSVIEAATLDGAGPLRRARFIVWPGVRYMTVLVAIIALLSFTNGSFDLVNILTKGDPIYATQTLGLLHLRQRLQLRPFRLRGGAVGPADRVGRRHPARPPAPVEVAQPVTRSSRATRGISTRTTRRIRIFFATVCGLLLASPMLYMVAGSLMSNTQLSVQPPQVIPSSFHFANYSDAFSGMTQVIQPRSFLNSVIFTVGAVGLQWVLCISGGLVIAKMRFRSRNLITAMFAISLFIPLITTLIPTFIVTYELRMINTYPGLILPIAAQTGFGTLLFRQYISQMPEELFDAARIDGANWWTIFRRLAVPLAKPATAAYFAISVLTAWNMYLWPLVAAEGGPSRS